jgi:hypothetical protein
MFMPLQVLVQECSKDAYAYMTYDQADYEMCGNQPRPINCSTPLGSIRPGHKSTETTGQDCYNLCILFIYVKMAYQLRRKLWQCIDMKALTCPDKIIHETDQQETSKSNKTYGSHSQQSIFERLGSVQPRPSAHENNDAIVSYTYFLVLPSNSPQLSCIQNESGHLSQFRIGTKKCYVLAGRLRSA